MLKPTNELIKCRVPALPRLTLEQVKGIRGLGWVNKIRDTSLTKACKLTLFTLFTPDEAGSRSFDRGVQGSLDKLIVPMKGQLSGLQHAKFFLERQSIPFRDTEYVRARNVAIFFPGTIGINREGEESAFYLSIIPRGGPPTWGIYWIEFSCDFDFYSRVAGTL